MNITLEMILILAAIFVGLKFSTNFSSETFTTLFTAVVVTLVTVPFFEIVSRQMGFSDNRILPGILISTISFAVFKFMGGRRPVLGFFALMILFFTDSLVVLARQVDRLNLLPPDLEMFFYALAAVLFFLSLFF